jgi:branched-subunit amino acid ABC-type transport system permease component
VRPLGFDTNLLAVSLTLQVLVTGLAAGGVYGLVAVGQSLIYRLTGIVYLAYGDLVGLGVFATLLVVAGTGPVTQATANGPRFVLALVIGVAVCIAAGAGSFLFAVQPYLARGSTVGWVAATVAIAFAIRSVLAAVFTRQSYVFPDALPFRDIGRDGFVTIGGASVQVRSFFVIGVAVALAAAAGWVLERTRFGRGLQAIAADADGARIVGVPVDVFVALAFGIVGGLAALAAIVAAPSGAVEVDTGALIGLKGLVAALIVRFGSPLRAMAAGLALGVVEAAIANVHLGDLDLGPAYREVLPLALVLLFVAMRPQREAVEEIE